MKKNVTVGISKIFDNKVRLGIMSILAVNEWVDFNTFKEMLNLSDGRLASHVSVLEEAHYLEVRKQFIGKKPHTSYRITPEGKKAFQDHLNILEQLIRQASREKK